MNAIFNIAVTSYNGQGVSNHWQMDCLLKVLFMLTDLNKETTEIPHYWSFVRGIIRWPRDQWCEKIVLFDMSSSRDVIMLRDLILRQYNEAAMYLCRLLWQTYVLFASDCGVSQDVTLWWWRFDELCHIVYCRVDSFCHIRLPYFWWRCGELLKFHQIIRGKGYGEISGHRFNMSHMPLW